MMLWSSNKTYTDEDIRRMQQEAVDRVQEFQSRAKETHPFYDFSGTGSVPVIEAPSRIIPDPELPPQAEATAPIIPKTGQNTNAPLHNNPLDPFKGLLEQFNIDSETLMILGLMFLLYNEKADNSLLIALGYLLL